MNALNNFDKTADDLVRFWRSKVKGQGHSRPSKWRRHSCQRYGVEVHLSVSRGLCFQNALTGFDWISNRGLTFQRFKKKFLGF